MLRQIWRLLPHTALLSPALDEVGYIARHAGGCSSYMEWLTSGGACKSLPRSECADMWGNIGFQIDCYPRVGLLLAVVRWTLTKRLRLVGSRPQWGAMGWWVGGGGRHGVCIKCWVCGPDFSLDRQWPSSTLRLQLTCGLPTRAQLLSYIYTKAQFNSFSCLRDYFFLLKYNWYVTGMYMCPSDLLLWVTRYTE